MRFKIMGWWDHPRVDLSSICDFFGSTTDDDRGVKLQQSRVNDRCVSK